MKVHVEPTPLHEPLPGGTPGATVSVEPLVAGHVNVPRAVTERPSGRFPRLKVLWARFGGHDDVRLPTPAFLIHHPGAGPLLVDTGLHPSIGSDPRGNFGRLGARFVKPTLAPGEDVPAQLRARGLEASRIPTVVMTHLHLDRSSAISEFPNSSFVLSEVEWLAASGGGQPLSYGYRRTQFDYAFDYRTINFNREGIDSYSSFARCFDLFGDGSIRLAYTPGHSAGHISVIARLKEHDFVIGGDTVYTISQLDGGAPLPPRPFDAHNYRRSLQELKVFRREYPQAIVAPGRDAGFYEQLDKRYD